MGKIKILYTIPNFDTAGSGKALLNIAKLLDKNIFEPHIACLHSKGVFFETVKQSGIPVYLLPLYSDARPLTKLFAQSWRLRKMIKDIGPDIVHSFNYSADYTEALAVRMAGKKWIYTKKNMNWGGSSKNGWKLRTFLANNIIAQNTDMINLFFPKNKNVTLIPRGVNIDEFRPKQPVAELRQKWNIPANASIILCVANMLPVKGIEVLIEAFIKTTDLLKNNSSVLLLVGDNKHEHGQYLIDLVKRQKNSDRIIFTGKQFNVSDYNSIADVFVLPTLDKWGREGSPVALLEAMASGNVCVASDIAGIRDQLSSSKNMLFEAGNADALAKKLVHFLSIPASEKAILKESMRKIVLDNYTLETEIKRHQDLYLECVKVN
jgi:glycosyltransferase involved in cell wall biosynthesis